MNRVKLKRKFHICDYQLQILCLMSMSQNWMNRIGILDIQTYLSVVILHFGHKILNV